METRCRITSGGGDPRESATETKPPRATGARVKRCGKSAPRTRQRGRHGKPHQEQDRIGATRVLASKARFQPCRPGWLLEAAGNGRPRGMAAAPGTSRALQNPAYRPADALVSAAAARVSYRSLTLRLSDARVRRGKPAAIPSRGQDPCCRKPSRPERTGRACRVAAPVAARRAARSRARPAWAARMLARRPCKRTDRRGSRFHACGSAVPVTVEPSLERRSCCSVRSPAARCPGERRR